MAPSAGCHSFRFSIDRGGTFTDVYAEYEDDHGGRQELVLKLLSVDPANYPDAPRVCASKAPPSWAPSGGVDLRLCVGRRSCAQRPGTCRT